MTHRERFLSVMSYQPVDRVPNWEAGVWTQTRSRWEREGAPVEQFHWDWFQGEASLGMDSREFIPFQGGLVPPYPETVLEEDERTQLIRDNLGRVRRALKEGAIGKARMSMDRYVSFAVNAPRDWEAVKKRLVPTDLRRYAPHWQTFRAEGLRHRSHPLIFAPNTQTKGFYWFARELMGTEGLSYAWYDQPSLMHDMMSFWGDFLIEAARPVLKETDVDYVMLAEDLAMKTGPLLSPATYREFILPHMQRVVEFLKSHGVKYVCVDTDGNPEPILPLMLDAGVDAIWPMERAADQDPIRLRKTFGRMLRLWGGVDKRELAKGPAAIDAHLRTLAPLIEEGGFIPTIDHTVPPDVSWADFAHYMMVKAQLLCGRL